MNANAIQEKILSDARTSASDIMRDANEKAARLRDAAEKRMAAAHSRLMMQASEDAEAARLRMERMEELEERKRLLSDKRALIDEAVSQGRSRAQAVATYVTDEAFEAWYQSFCQALNAAAQR